MVRHAFTLAIAAAAFAGTAFTETTCTRQKKCPADTPCCGLYGQCGVGAFCLGGCDPTMSTTFDSCVPNPSCKSGNYAFTDLKDMQSNQKYLGDSAKINWQAQGNPIKYPSGGVALTMAENTVGTLLASTFYVWYGKICATMSTSQGPGVVTAFIMMSDVKDEIDFEFIGNDIANAQSNWYSQGVTNYKNMEKLEVSPDTVGKTHEYCIDWSEDELSWSVDGNKGRTVKRADSWNATSGRFDYPQTPSRIMLSLWPAGLSTNAKGTIEWAGGEIDWNSEYMTNGMYAALVTKVTVDCYDAPSGIKSTGSKSYKYTSNMPTNNTVEITNDLVVLESLMDTGDAPGSTASASASKASSSAKSTKPVNMVPGGNPGGGGRQDTPLDPSSTAQATSGPDSGSSGSSGSSSGSSATFDQGNTGSSGSALEPGLAKIGGSAIAIVFAIFGLLAL
ncbi:glycoside hydrolase family 16 protein [Karstenula rhodostoma CBS 690.94]|uniref:Crh-like protein n=1 Tax=Karstenula rhodostoma CBS 690.94 TaxID=1392251 RepID=A0A9P4PBE9_9PLEO|nr:glycoside hydrolase family 16 protein [Karstenula rhodostoma CBS 690.94]